MGKNLSLLELCHNLYIQPLQANWMVSNHFLKSEIILPGQDYCPLQVQEGRLSEVLCVILDHTVSAGPAL